MPPIIIRTPRRQSCKRKTDPTLREGTGAWNAGIDPKRADEISGHKTTSMEARYNILDDADLKDPAAKMNSFLAAQKSVKLKRVK